jgi:hypothetical protein
MAHFYGSVSSWSSLIDAVFDALVSEGWASSGSIISKGDINVQLEVSGNYLTIKGGTGSSAGALTGAGPNIARMGPVAGEALSWPVEWALHVFADPDEVYLVVTLLDRYYWLAFGGSSVDGVPGTGGWYAASLGESVAFISMTPISGGQPGSNLFGPLAPFWLTDSSSLGFLQNSFVHHGFDGGGWSGVVVASSAIAVQAARPHIERSPNAWNQECALLPIQVYVPRSSSKVSLVLDLVNARYIRIDNYEPGEIVTLGADRWRFYPFYRKNSSVRDGGGGINHSGTLGWAIRYDGP